MENLINPSHGGNSESHSSSSSLDSLKPSVVVITLILLMTLLISVSICFLLRCLNRCSHGGSLPPSSFTTVASDSRRFSGHRVSPETVRSSVLDSLPIFKYSSITRRSTSSTSGDCAVCLSKFEPEDQLRLLPLCCHAFHADCIDIWLVSNQTCPLCRSPLFASETDLMKSLAGNNNNNNVGENSFRLEIGSISRRQIPIPTPESGDQNGSYSIGSFDYIVDDFESEISESDFNRRKQEDATATATATTTNAVGAVTSNQVAFEASLAAEIGNNEGSRSWLKEYVDRLSRGISSRAMSFRSSGRFFTGSSRRSEEIPVVDLEANLPGEELFRWLSGM